MLSIHKRTREQVYQRHLNIPVRVYANDGQSERIERSRRLALFAVADGLISDLHPQIIELGCGTADISGMLSDNPMLTCKGIDCASAPLDEAAKRWPRLYIGKLDIQSAAAIRCDVLILTETLEHISDPIDIVQRWLPLADFCLISHPLDEPIESSLSAGEHNWSFSCEDFENWFKLGGHKILQQEDFQMGSYHIVLGLGKNLKTTS